MTGHREAGREEAFRAFREALAPLEAAGKLRGVLLQYPPRFVKSQRGARRAGRGRAAARAARAAGRVPPPLVARRGRARRHALVPRAARPRLRLGRLTPHAREQRRARGSPPPPTAVAYVRFHGRNWRTWNLKGKTSAERFDWMYDRDRARGVGRAARRARSAGRGGLRALQQQPGYDYAPRSATDPPRPARRAGDRRPRARVEPPETGQLELDSVNVLAVIHGTNARAGDVRRGRRRSRPPLRGVEPRLGHTAAAADRRLRRGARLRRLDARRPGRPSPLAARGEPFIQRLLDRHVPLFGVCLGVQLIAKAEGAARLPRCPAGPRSAGSPVDADRGRRRRPRLRQPAASVRRVRVALLHLRRAGRARGARAQRALQSGVQARRGRLGHPVPRRGDARHRAHLARRQGRSSRHVPDREALAAETEERIASWNDLGSRASAARSSRSPSARRSPSTQRSIGRSAWRDHSCHEPG